MAKNEERIKAKELFLLGKNQNEIAAALNVQPKTIGQWVKKYGWKNERDARLGSSKSQIQNIKAIISSLAEDRIALSNTIKKAKEDGDKELIQESQKEISKIDNAAAYWNKALTNLDKENRISLSVYLEVMDDIFKALQKHNPKLFMKTIEFQEQHLSNISLR
ncbi:helix-turn-helix domain-containing protein [Tenacibaculum maritimum]|uniref:terminase gpP N-terminus-related DNA-binding protein n=1 Tax=Tenacibaculum maritimum TaxID=107401 RepID=UPI0038909F6C